MRHYNAVLDSLDIVTSIAQDTLACERLKRGCDAIPSFLYNLSFQPNDSTLTKTVSRNLKCLNRLFNMVIVRDPRLTDSVKSSIIGLEIVKGAERFLPNINKRKTYTILSPTVSYLQYFPEGCGIVIKDLIITKSNITTFEQLNRLLLSIKEFCLKFKVKKIYLVLPPEAAYSNILAEYRCEQNIPVDFIIDMRTEYNNPQSGLRKCIEESGFPSYLLTKPVMNVLTGVNQYIYQEANYKYFYSLKNRHKQYLYNVIYYINGDLSVNYKFNLNLFNIVGMNL